MKTGHIFTNFAKSFKNGFNFAEKPAELLFSSNLILKNITIFAFAFFVGIISGLTFNHVNTSSATSQIEVAPKVEKSVIDTKEKVEKSNLAEISNNNASTYSYTTSTYKNTVNASTYNANTNTSAQLNIPKIGLYTNIVSTGATTPTYGVGQYGNLLIGHNTGIFSGLTSLTYGDKITLYGKKYTVYATSIETVSDDMKKAGNYTTAKLGYGMGSDLVLMTCYGSMRTFNNGQVSASQRFLVFAHLD